MKIKLDLPYDIGRKLIMKQREDGYGDKSLEEYVGFLVKDVFRDPSLTQATISELQEMWMKNFGENLPYIRYGDKLELKANEYVQNNLVELAEPKFPDLKNPPKSSAVVIGAGPSVFMNKHLDLLAEAVKSGRYKGIICATDKILVSCLERGIIPDITTTVDGHITIKSFYDHPLVREYGPKIKVAFSVTINNEAYLVCRDAGIKVYWFYAMQDDWRKTYSFTKLEGLMVKSKHFTKTLQRIACGGNCGYTAWVMASNLFKRAPVALIGIDFGYPEGCDLVTTTYFSAIEHNLPMGSARAIAVKTMYEDVYHPYFKKWAKIDKVFKSYRKSLLEAQKHMAPWFRHYDGTINCTEGGTLYGPNIQCMKFADFLQKYKT